MKILALDTTGIAMSAAVWDGDAPLSEIYVNNGKKHSETLMPAVDYALSSARSDIMDMDAIAVTVGPGSFTGIRIGVATAQALSYAAEKPLYAVNTLDALMENTGEDAVVCAVMDARRGEVYAAARRADEEFITGCALPLTELLEKLSGCGGVVFVGDGAVKYTGAILEAKPDARFLPEQFMLQRASSVAACVWKNRAVLTAHDAIKPHYLRESQAERRKRTERVD